MKKIALNNELFLTVVEEADGFHISVVDENDNEVNGFVDSFTNLKDAETACAILANVIIKGGL